MSPNSTQLVEHVNNLRSSIFNYEIFPFLKASQLSQDGLFKSFRSRDALLVVQSVEGILNFKDLWSWNVAFVVPSNTCDILSKDIEPATLLIILPKYVNTK